MNTAGIEHDHIYNKFFTTGENPHILAIEYTFDSWYDAVKTHCRTPHSYIYDIFNKMDNINIYLSNPISSVKNESEELKNMIEWIDALIKMMPGGKCFAKLDTVSTKSYKPYFNTESILKDIYKTSRTFNSLTSNSKLIIREWVEFEFEFRCFVHEETFRGISCENKKDVMSYLVEIKELIDNLVFYTGYDACTIDLGIVNGKLTLVEINTPVYLFATSGNFDLNTAYDHDVLLGELLPEYITYPVILDSQNRGLYHI